MRGTCKRCGRTNRSGHLSKTFDGFLCGRCYKETGPKEPCSACGRMKQVTSRKTGVPLCGRCYIQPMNPCTRCGNIKPIVSRRNGAVCHRCYQATERSREICSGCSLVKPIVSRNTGASLCSACYQRLRLKKRSKDIAQRLRHAARERSDSRHMPDDAIREMIRANESFDQRKLIDWIEFRHLRFCWNGSARPGWQLLRALGVPDTREGYDRLMLRLFPDALTGRVLVRKVNDERWSMTLEWDRPCSQDPGATEGRPVLGASREPNPTPHDLYEEAEERRWVRRLIEALAPSRQKDMLLRYYGFIDESAHAEDWTLEEIAVLHGVSGERVRQLIAGVLRKLRQRPAVQSWFGLDEYTP